MSGSANSAAGKRFAAQAQGGRSGTKPAPPCASRMSQRGSAPRPANPAHNSRIAVRHSGCFADDWR